MTFKLTGDTNAVRNRQKVEQTIARAVVDALLAADFVLGVNDGGDEPVITGSSDKAAILEALFNTDEDYLLAKKRDDSHFKGWVRFVYGNDGWDVISDYTVNLEPWIGEGTVVEKLIKSFE
jgi:hypothetical protein